MTDTKSPRIPQFQSVEEEAAFWDTHDVTAYLDELKPVEARFTRGLSESMTIRFDADTAVELRKQAQEKGIGPTTLVRMIVKEQLRGNNKQP